MFHGRGAEKGPKISGWLTSKQIRNLLEEKRLKEGPEPENQVNRVKLFIYLFHFFGLFLISYYTFLPVLLFCVSLAALDDILLGALAVKYS